MSIETIIMYIILFGVMGYLVAFFLGRILRKIKKESDKKPPAQPIENKE